MIIDTYQTELTAHPYFYDIVARQELAALIPERLASQIADQPVLYNDGEWIDFDLNKITFSEIPPMLSASGISIEPPYDFMELIDQVYRMFADKQMLLDLEKKSVKDFNRVVSVAVSIIYVYHPLPAKSLFARILMGEWMQNLPVEPVLLNGDVVYMSTDEEGILMYRYLQHEVRRLLNGLYLQDHLPLLPHKDDRDLSDSYIDLIRGRTLRLGPADYARGIKGAYIHDLGQSSAIILITVHDAVGEEIGVSITHADISITPERMRAEHDAMHIFCDGGKISCTVRMQKKNYADDVLTKCLSGFPITVNQLLLNLGENIDGLTVKPGNVIPVVDSSKIVRVAHVSGHSIAKLSMLHALRTHMTSLFAHEVKQKRYLHELYNQHLAEIAISSLYYCEGAWGDITEAELTLTDEWLVNLLYEVGLYDMVMDPEQTFRWKRAIIKLYQRFPDSTIDQITTTVQYLACLHFQFDSHALEASIDTDFPKKGKIKISGVDFKTINGTTSMHWFPLQKWMKDGCERLKGYPQVADFSAEVGPSELPDDSAENVAVVEEAPKKKKKKKKQRSSMQKDMLALANMLGLKSGTFVSLNGPWVYASTTRWGRKDDLAVLKEHGLIVDTSEVGTNPSENYELLTDAVQAERAAMKASTS